jgi:hypothetical protein
MNKIKEDKIKKMNSKPFILFIKIFIIYIFLEYFLLSLSQNTYYYYAIKFLGDFLLLVFVAYTILRLKKIGFHKGQRISLVCLFILVALLSTLKNQLSLFDLLLGLRSLFRYYLVFFLSFYYDIKEIDFKKISGFIIKSFYFEIIIFLVNYFIFNKIEVLQFGYLALGVYVNVVFALVLFENKFKLRNITFMILLAIQAFLLTSRLAFIGIMLQSIIFILFVWKKRALIKAFAIATILILGVLLFYTEPLNTKITTSETYRKIIKTRLEPEEDFRVYLFVHFTELSIQNVNLIGDGPNTFGARSLDSSYFHEDYLYEQGFDERTIAYSADSHYTILLMSYGFIGLIIYYLLILLVYTGTKPEYKKFMMMYLGFIMLASFALPIFSMRLSSFLMFAFFGLTHKED